MLMKDLLVWMEMFSEIVLKCSFGQRQFSQYIVLKQKCISVDTAYDLCIEFSGLQVVEACTCHISYNTALVSDLFIHL